MERKFLKIILIIIAAIVVLILGLIGFLFLQREYQIAKLSDYYQELAEKCKEKDNVNCCISSVERMAAGNYKPLDDNERRCPDGFEFMQLKCISSYKWCKPIPEGWPPRPAVK